jgi:hypothetical protein
MLSPLLAARSGLFYLSLITYWPGYAGCISAAPVVTTAFDRHGNQGDEIGLCSRRGAPPLHYSTVDAGSRLTNRKSGVGGIDSRGYVAQFGIRLQLGCDMLTPVRKDR